MKGLIVSGILIGSTLHVGCGFIISANYATYGDYRYYSLATYVICAVSILVFFYSTSESEFVFFLNLIRD